MSIPSNYRFPGPPGPPGNPGDPRSDHTRIDPAALSTGAYLRALADGEVPEARPGAGEKHASLPCAAECVAFEQALRSSVAKAMVTPAAPAELRAKVQAILAAERTPDRVHESGRETPGVPSYKFQHRSRVGRLNRYVGVAALLALCGGVIFVSSRQSGISGPNALNPRVTSQASLLPVGLISEFVGKEHDRVADMGPAYEAKFKARDLEAAANAALDLFQCVPPHFLVRVDQLDTSGYRLAGFGPCSVPGEGKSGQFLFTPKNGEGKPISLFVQLDTGTLDVTSAQCNMCKKGCKSGAAMIAWKDDRFDYFLYTCDEKGMAAARAAMDAPKQIAEVR